MSLYFSIAIGSALGGMARYALDGFVSQRVGAAFPWGILLINVLGSFVIGFFATLTQPEGRFPVGPTGRMFFMTGVCGGFTTFSSFSLGTLNLARNGEWMRAGGYVIASVVFCLLGVWLGYIAAAAVNSLKGP